MRWSFFATHKNVYLTAFAFLGRNCVRVVPGYHTGSNARCSGHNLGAEKIKIFKVLSSLPCSHFFKTNFEQYVDLFEEVWMQFTLALFGIFFKYFSRTWATLDIESWEDSTRKRVVKSVKIDYNLGGNIKFHPWRSRGDIKA